MPRTISRDLRTGEAMETVAVVIPTLNEERSIGKVIDDVPVADLLKIGFETAVYVIDGRSTDNTSMTQTRRHRIPCVYYVLDHLPRLLSIWSLRIVAKQVYER